MKEAGAASGEKLCCIVLNFGEDEAAWPLVTVAAHGVGVGRSSLSKSWRRFVVAYLIAKKVRRQCCATPTVAQDA